MDDHFSDELFELRLKHEMREKLDDDELIELFEGAQERLGDAVDSYNNQFHHLLVNLMAAFNARETNLALLMRRYQGIRLRLARLDKAQFAMRGAYADIWQALETGLDDAPLKALSKRARDAAKGKHMRDPRTAARGSIREEWERWQRREVVYRGDADFGRKMHLKHPEFTSDRSIAQLAARWRKEGRGDE